MEQKARQCAIKNKMKARARVILAQGLSLSDA